MDEQVEQEIKGFLELMDAQTDSTLSPSFENQQGTEVIEIFVVRRQVEGPGPPTVESTLADTSYGEETRTAPLEQETTGETAFRTLPRKPRLRVLPFVIGVLCVLAAGLLGEVSLLTLLAPSATVTIVPSSAQISAIRTVTIVPANANPARQQIAGRLLDAITLIQAKTVPATGLGHEPAQTAHGLVTFYNALPAPQTIAAGELLTGADGVEIVTDEDALIPAATMPTEGQATVTAHAVIAGPWGNIRTGDIYGKCCRDDVFVSNGPFRGGQAARSYQIVTQQDIDSAESSIKADLEQSVQASLSQQVQSNETLIMPVPCNTAVLPDHQAGSEASQLRVMVSETCTGEVYTTNDLHDLLIKAMTQQAIQQLGTGYSLVGSVQSGITKATMNSRQGTVILQIKVAGTWMYQFSQAQQDRIKVSIRGKSKQEATALLLHMPDVQNVSIGITNGISIPTDTQHIHLVFVEIV
jgi:Baseplate J-like protein